LTEPAVSVTIESADAAEGPAGAGLYGLDEATLRRVVALTLARVGVTQPVELSIVVTDDEALRTLNREYRGRDELTDVLSFPLLDSPLVKAPEDQLWGAAEEEERGDTGERWGERQRDAQGDPTVVSYTEEGAAASQGEGEDTAGTEEPFAFFTPPDLPRHLGDVVVARGALERQAALAGHAPSWELGYLVAHGVLHLVGYDDHTDAGYAAMVAHQEAVLQEAGIQR
jgi:probable rRNA maturation factor